MVLNSSMQQGGGFASVFILLLLLVVVGVMAMCVYNLYKRLSASASRQADEIIGELDKRKEANAKDGLPPDNYLAWAILTTVFCCLPLGIIAIVKAASVNSAWRAGSREEAIKDSIAAKMWCQIGTFVPLGLFAIYMFFYLVIAIFNY